MTEPTRVSGCAPIITIFVALLLILGLAGATAATWLEDEGIAVVTERIEQHADSEDLVAGLNELYDISLDENVSVECRVYADVALASYSVSAVLAVFPESYGLDSLNESIIDYLPVARNDCQLSL